MSRLQTTSARLLETYPKRLVRLGRFAFIVCYVSAATLVAPLVAPWFMSRASAQDLPKYEVTGFRDVRFGQSEQEVRALVAKALNVKAADIVASSNPIEGTGVLTVTAPSLEPGPGPARIAYIFGHSSKRLIQINVVWGEDAPQNVDTVAAAGTRLQRYFSGFGWKKDAARAGIPVGENTIILFAGDDEKKGSVRLVIDGVKYQMQRDGNQPATSPEPKGPPKLMINYIADRENPDIAKIEKGKF
ncbi:MAG TPA: hypothetical protein VNR39_15770 [Pseudolabrys sp.]|nr:hypothetical protein [Pseudolabrys sp.]